jgi:hypothetical protein
MADFPFKTLTLYKVKQTFKSPRSGHTFEQSQQLTYQGSTLNHYEGIEICIFKDFISQETLVWHADELQLAAWNSFFEVVPFPK